MPEDYCESCGPLTRSTQPIFFAPYAPPWWRRTWPGRVYTQWRGRRQMRDWTVIGYTDETGTGEAR